MQATAGYDANEKWDRKCQLFEAGIFDLITLVLSLTVLLLTINVLKGHWRCFYCCKIKSNDSNLSTVISKVINTVTLNHRRILSEAREAYIASPKFWRLNFISCNMDTICIPDKSHQMLHVDVLCSRVKLTDLQICGCELHQNAFGGRAPPGPAGGAIALPRPPSRY